MSMMTPNGDEQPDVAAAASDAAGAAPGAASSSVSDAASGATSGAAPGAASGATSGAEAGGTAATPTFHESREPSVSRRRMATVLVGGTLVLALATWGFWSIVATRSEGGWGSTLGDPNKVSGAVGVNQGGRGEGGIVPDGDPKKSLEAAALVAGGAAAQNLGANPNGGSGSGAAGGAVDNTFKSAVGQCTAALGSATNLSTANGTTATLGTWAVKATSSVNALRAEAAALAANVATAPLDTVSTEASKVCASITGAGQLPAVPDAAASAAWHGALTQFAQGANDALKAANGDATAKAPAAAALAQGEADLNTLSARILVVAP
jgi:hypothetical protein